MAARKVFKIKPADLGKLDEEDSLKLTATVGSALMTQPWLVGYAGNFTQKCNESSSLKKYDAKFLLAN